MAEPNTARAARGPTSGVHPAAKDPPKPLLASEVLQEELAPLQPALRQSRYWFIAVATALALLGMGFQSGVGDAGAATIAYSAAGAVAAVAILPFPYALRAGVALLLGWVLMALGLKGSGPLTELVNYDGNWGGVFRMLTLTLLPAALLFRARYRTYPRARRLLAAALLASLPFVVAAVTRSLNVDAGLIARAAATLSVAAVACSLFGFMGESTTGAATLWALLILLVLPAELMFAGLSGSASFLTHSATALATLCAALLGALGLFQLVASMLAPEARRISQARMSRPVSAEPSDSP